MFFHIYACIVHSNDTRVSLRIYMIYHVSYSMNVHAHFPPQNTRMRVSLRPFARGCLLHIFVLRVLIVSDYYERCIHSRTIFVYYFLISI